ncbi:hypothetical protein FSZ31_06905 [Sphingorhabdus soli]|uniref:Pilus assembly protein CpaD n=1 Tax=Flavisphingopyxis soli TaxID=2601267 RepID=A0A5C6U7C6_9SPHN|nr:CpaD family pilus assembly protein [Sphingorhabdus soli]TXC68704.1 hypothetical protein FSZ31_06905 [Sphingorhabdus soli]
MIKAKLLVPAAVALALGACNTGTAVSNRGLESVHQPVVGQQAYSLDLQLAGGELPPSEQGRLAGWLEALDVGYGDRVAIDDGTSYDAASARATIGRMLGVRGLLMAAGAPVTPGVVAPGSIRVVVLRSTAWVPNCPDTATTYASNPTNSTSSNYGCAINSNLAAMVADPQDLIKGQAGALTDPKTATKAIGVYRDAVPTGSKGLTETSTSDGGGK